MAKINTFFAEKLAEATRKFTNLKAELDFSKSTQQLNQIAKNLPPQANGKRTGKMHELAFSEFYLSLVLLQNYQNLNFSGFGKILKKHDKLMSNDAGAKWRQTHVDLSPFHTNKGVANLIEDTESLFTNELVDGDRQKAMKRLRVPPIKDRKSRWTSFKVVGIQLTKLSLQLLVSAGLLF